MSLQMLPLVAFDRIDNEQADHLLTAWGHWLGGCNRPFGKHAFGLALDGRIISVAVSASTVNPTCAGYARGQVVELARIASAPEHCKWVCRVTLRLWRQTAPAAWAADYWPCVAAVSYQDAARHTGNLYRFDGWKRLAEVRGGTAGGNWTRGKTYRPKVVWGYALTGRDAA